MEKCEAELHKKLINFHDIIFKKYLNRIIFLDRIYLE